MDVSDLPQKAAPIRHADDSGDAQDLEQFIYLVSHDLRNSVRALCELPTWIREDLLRAGELDDEVAQNLDLMALHTSRLDQMLKDLLVYSRIGRNQAISAIDLDACADMALAELRLPPDMQVTRAFDAQSVRMGQRDAVTLLRALISNGCRHHDRRRGTIHLSSRFHGDHTCISVTDDGPGIPPDRYEYVCGIMTTLRPRDEVEGSGMGLAIACKIAAAHGGSLRLSAPENARGLCASVFIPHDTA